MWETKESEKAEKVVQAFNLCSLEAAAEVVSSRLAW